MVTQRVTAEMWRSRVRGCLVGGSIGDALGAPFEGRTSVSEPDVQNIIDGSRRLLWTDDTALQLALAGYLSELDHPSEFDDAELAHRFALAWHENPQRGYGSNPPAIFRAVLEGGPWRELATASFAGAGSLGNGGAMRAAPLGVLAGRDTALVEFARRSAAVTHAHPLGQDGAVVIAVAAAAAFTVEHGREPESGAVIDACSRAVTTPDMRRVLGTVRSVLPEREPVEVAKATGSGIAAHEAAPAALSAFLRHPREPVEAVTFAVSMGGDTDTVAAMAGSLAGAVAGEGGLPERLVERIDQIDRILQVADNLARRSFSWLTASSP